MGLVQGMGVKRARSAAHDPRFYDGLAEAAADSVECRVYNLSPSALWIAELRKMFFNKVHTVFTPIKLILNDD